jgi:hypothetical protein
MIPPVTSVPLPQIHPSTFSELRSVSEDDDYDEDDDASSQRKDPPDNKLNLSPNTNLDAVAYLLRYETMVRQQEAEDMAVIAHLRPCFTELLALLEESKGNDSSKANFSLDSEISFQNLQKAVEKIEQTTEKQKIMMTTDRQLMMVLKMLTHKGIVATDGDHDAADDEETKGTITWAEIVQCYKICISGMITLQHMPTDSPWRARTRDRTLAMLSLFETPSTRLFTNELQLSGSKAVEHNDNTKRNDSSATSWMDSQRGLINTPAESQKDAVSAVKATSHHHQKNRRFFKRKTEQRLIASFLFLGLILLAAWIMGRPPSVSFVSSKFIPTGWKSISSASKTATLETSSSTEEFKSTLLSKEQPVSSDLTRDPAKPVEHVVSSCNPVEESHHRPRKNDIVAFVSDHIRQSLWMLV